jgi:hypothetical protein
MRSCSLQVCRSHTYRLKQEARIRRQVITAVKLNVHVCIFPTFDAILSVNIQLNSVVFRSIRNIEAQILAYIVSNGRFTLFEGSEC